MLPNLFHFATSELSQDAVLCWLLSWADTKYKSDHPHLHAASKALFTMIYERAGLKVPIEFHNIEVRKQDGGIDILCFINGETAILIEDKVGTHQHSDQLVRYKDYVFKERGFPSDKVIPIYIQTGDQSDYSEVAKHGYSIVERIDLLNVFESETGIIAKSKSDIMRDFAVYLRQIEDDVQSFHTLPPSDWSWNSWIGFYTTIQKQLKDGNWDYVSNPAGGFLGFWWYSHENDECEVYLQLEQERFCFKISVDDAEKRRELRQHWYEKFISKCPEQGLKVRRPDRFGNGQYMTVAILDEEYRVVGANRLIDLAETLKIIQYAQHLIDACL